VNLFGTIYAPRRLHYLAGRCARRYHSRTAATHQPVSSNGDQYDSLCHTCSNTDYPSDGFIDSIMGSNSTLSVAYSN
jgi:hypothetical protein